MNYKFFPTDDQWEHCGNGDLVFTDQHSDLLFPNDTAFVSMNGAEPSPSNPGIRVFAMEKAGSGYRCKVTSEEGLSKYIDGKVYPDLSSAWSAFHDFVRQQLAKQILDDAQTRLVHLGLQLNLKHPPFTAGE